MKIIIIGAGKTGSTIIKHVSNEEHEVVVIDDNPNVVAKIVEKYDVMGITGSGVSYDIQKSAGSDTADLVIACAASDESNMLSCLIAKKLGAKNTIARIRDYEYSKQSKLMLEALDITMSLNPEMEAAIEINRLINFPEATKIETFASGKVDLVELKISEGSPLIGMSLYQMNGKLNTKVLVCAVSRDKEVFIPTGDFVFEEKDIIHFTADRKNSRKFIEKLGLAESKMRDIMIIGGGKIAMYLAEELSKNRFLNIKIIERDHDRCVELSEALKRVTVVNGDGSDQTVLKEEGISQTDAMICLTGIDEENIIVSMYAKTQNVKKIIAKINKTSFGELLHSINMASVISPQEIVAQEIISYIRAASNTRGNNIKTLYKLVDDRVEALEFLVSESSNLKGKVIRDLHLKNGVLIGGIIRQGEVIIPEGSTSIEANDSIIIISKTSMLNDLDDIEA